MTTMRPDGRRGGGDCLHFFLPGVPDWWTHKLLVQLKHWAAHLRGRSRMNRRRGTVFMGTQFPGPTRHPEAGGAP